MAFSSTSFGMVVLWLAAIWSIVSPNRTLKFTGLSYLTNFVLPNFFFHESVTYALLRQNGVEVGKADFLGSLGQ